MKEVINKLVVSTEIVSTKNICLYLDEQLFILDGNWYWELSSDAIFCSDVILSFPPGFNGTKSIIHPEDTEKIRNLLELLKANASSVEINFRIITTYGEIKTIAGNELQFSKYSLIHFCLPQEDSENMETTEKWIDENEKLIAEKQALKFAEEISKAGSWYYNTVTGKTFYSDTVYSIHGLPPQSMNAHLNIFSQYIHSEDRETVETAFDVAFERKIPLQIYYRIDLNDGVKKNIELITKWNFNENGEHILNGVVKDITEQLIVEQKLQHANSELAFRQKFTAFAEQSLQAGSWQIDLLTRKTIYSDNCYRIFGIKPQAGKEGVLIFNKLVHPDDLTLVDDAYRKMIFEHVAPDIEYRVVKENGKVAHVKQKGKLISHGDSDLIITGIIEDITQERTLINKGVEARHLIAVNNFAIRYAEEISGMAHWSWHIETGETYWSDSFYHLLGYKPNTIALSQKILLNYIYPEDRNLFSENFGASLKNRNETEFEFRLVRRGEIKYIKASFRIFEYETGTYFFAFLLDITKEHQLISDMQDKSQFTHLISDAICDRLLVTDINYRITEWNQRCEETFGKTKEEVLHQNFFDIFPVLKTEEIFTDFRKVLEGNSVTIIRQSFFFNQIWNIYLAPLKDNRDEVIGIIHILRDITKEQALQKELSERLIFIEKLVECSVDKIVVLNKELNFLYWNKKAEEYYCLSKQQVIGKNIMEVFPAMNETPSYFQFRKVLQGETVHIPANNSIHGSQYQDSFLVPIKNDKEQARAILWIMHDVTHEVELNRQQQKADVILNTINEGFYELDEQLRFNYINKKCEQLWNICKEDLLGENLWKVFPQAIDSPLYFAIQYVMEEKAVVRKEFVSPISNRQITTTIIPSPEGVIVFFRESEE
jgi:PAS domain S-box-containing protein